LNIDEKSLRCVPIVPKLRDWGRSFHPNIFKSAIPAVAFSPHVPALQTSNEYLKKAFENSKAFQYAVTSKLLFVTLVEFVDTTCCIHQYVFTSVERMAGIRDLQFDHWILVAIFPFDGFFAACCRFTQERMSVTHVFKHYELIICGVEFLFHIFFFLCMDFAMLVFGVAKVG
jgi:hypothetical protein